MNRIDPYSPQRYWLTDPLLPGPGIFASRGLVYLTLGLLVAATIWAALAEVDIVVSARGRLVVKGEPIELTAPERALVVDVPVRVGQRVEAGTVLIRLDSFAYRTEANRAKAEINGLRVEVERHRDASRAIGKARSSIQIEYEAVTRLVTLLAEELDRLEILRNDGVSSVAELKTQQRQLEEARARQARIQADLAQRDLDASERERLALVAKRKIAAFEIEHSKLLEYEKRTMIRAPVAATVTHLGVLHAGSVIETTRPAVILVPDDRPLLARIDIPNRCMRRVRRGLWARLEFNAYPRESFGYFEGALIDIEPDADDAGNYKAWVSLASEESVGQALISRLKPGLLMEAKIVVDRRCVLGYLFKPLRMIEPSGIEE